MAKQLNCLFFIFAVVTAAFAGKLSRINSSCGDGWSQLCSESDDCYCYQFIDAFARQEIASYICNGFGGELVSIHSEEQNRFLYVFPDDFANGAWIGLTKEDSTFAWLDGSEYDYSNWHLDAPSNYTSGYDCAHFVGYLDEGYSIPFQWKDAPCSNLRQIICQKSVPTAVSTIPPPTPCPPLYEEKCFTTGCSCYSFSNSSASWRSAVASCRQGGADLVSIHSGSEDDYIRALAFTETWIGTAKSDPFWVDGSAVGYTNWYSSSTGYYGYASPSYSGWLGDSSPSSSRRYVCKRPTYSDC